MFSLTKPQIFEPFRQISKSAGNVWKVSIVALRRIFPDSAELQHKMSTQAEGRKTIVNEYDNRPPSRLVLTEADLHPVFIVVQVLEKGQYFVS